MSDNEQPVASFVENAPTYTFEQALNLARLWKQGKLIGGDYESVIFALLEEIERRTRTQKDDEDMLVSFGDLRGFNLAELNKIMSGGVDNNHEGMVEEHIRAFNYAVTQGIHPGQALLAIAQGFATLLGFAIRSGLSPEVAGQLVALVVRTTKDSATNVQIVIPS